MTHTLFSEEFYYFSLCTVANQIYMFYCFRLIKMAVRSEYFMIIIIFKTSSIIHTSSRVYPYICNCYNVSLGALGKFHSSFGSSPWNRFFFVYLPQTTAIQLEKLTLILWSCLTNIGKFLVIFVKHT